MIIIDLNYFCKLSVATALFGITLILVVCWNLTSLWQKRRIFEFAKTNKGHNFYPIIGNGIHILGKDVFTSIQDVVKKFGLPCNLWLGHDYNYLTADASEIKIVLTKQCTLDKMNAFKAFKVIFGNALLLAQADVWKTSRKFFSKSFTQTILNGFVPTFYKNSVILVDVLNNVGDRDLFNVFARTSFDNFCETIIGKNYNLQQRTEIKFLEWVDEVQLLGSKQIGNYLHYPTITLVFRKEALRLVCLIFKAQNFVKKILNDKKKSYAENPIYVDDCTHFTLVDAMLHEEEQKPNSKPIFQELCLFMAAATDTSSNTLAFTFMFLGMHPEIQKQVYEEVISVVGRDEPIETNHLPSLKYTERVILESMRLLPVTPFIGRMATEDINIGNKVFPKGGNFLICIYNLHRNEKYWPNPLNFDPDRFLPEEVKKREPYSYIPFSAGPRNCIGKTYAMMFMKTVVANVIRNFEVASKYKSVEELEFTTCITMRTLHSLDCRFKSRIDIKNK